MLVYDPKRTNKPRFNGKRVKRGLYRALDGRLITAAYCRVSSPAQRPDLQNQRAALDQYTQSKGIAVDEWVMEIGGGLNFERKRFLGVVDAVLAGEVKCVVIAYQD